MLLIWMTCRFIPACAGNTVRGLRYCIRETVHPRVCREHVHLPRLALPRGRFIPACAGNTVELRLEPGLLSSVHPRVCREHVGRRATRSPGLRFIPACVGNSAVNRIMELVLSGSSPRVQGTQMLRWTRDSRTGPVHPRVCREHSHHGQYLHAVLTVHPRVCGELTHPVAAHAHTAAGSSPRVQGTQNRQAVSPMPISVHPRVCREHESNPDTDTEPDGSSPRVQGTLQNEPVQVGYSRFIPACAGNTFGPFGITQILEVHPRVCREHTNPTCRPACMTGSSPRVQGTRPNRRDRPTWSRFIPACAGNTLPFSRRELTNRLPICLVQEKTHLPRGYPFP